MGLCQGKLMTLTKQLFLMSSTLLQAVRPGQGSCIHKKGGPPGIQHPLDRTPSCLSPVHGVPCPRPFSSPHLKISKSIAPINHRNLAGSREVGEEVG